MQRFGGMCRVFYRPEAVSPLTAASSPLLFTIQISSFRLLPTMLSSYASYKIDVKNLFKWRVCIFFIFIYSFMFYAYCLQIFCNGQVWSVEHRFSEFCQLHERLARDFSGKKTSTRRTHIPGTGDPFLDDVSFRMHRRLPILPAKTWCRRIDGPFLESRRLKLQDYLHELLSLGVRVIDNRRVREFLYLDDSILDGPLQEEDESFNLEWEWFFFFFLV